MLSNAPAEGNAGPPLPFGRYRGAILGSVPGNYLAWLLLSVRLSSNLRRAVAAELARRGERVPEPPPYRQPTCRRCGPGPGVSYLWMQDTRGNRRVRCECNGCSAWLGFAPSVEPFTVFADAAASPTAALDVLTQAEDLGIRIESDGQVADFAPGHWRHAPEGLRARLRECRGSLGKMLGPTANGGV